MKKIKRELFLKLTALAALAPLGNRLLAGVQPVNIPEEPGLADDLMKRLSIANDQQVEGLLASLSPDKFNFSRKAGFDFAVLSASFCYAGSRYYQSQAIVPKLEILMQGLQNAQAEDGTVNIGNLESPPDTAFLLEPLTAAAGLLKKNNSNELSHINLALKKFIQKAGDGLTTGGVHTPNHRWVVCGALARINAIYPNRKYINRIEEWLGEGIFNDSDGHYPERSRIYSGVENNSLITMGQLLNKPPLFEPVRKNLDSTYYYMEPDGDLVTTDSRRQDQYGSKTIISYYLQYRFLAIRDGNRSFAGIARLIEQMKGFDTEILNRSLFYFLENPMLQQELPADVAPSVNYNKFFTTSQLLRIRRGDSSATLFGGVDWPLIIASGRSNSPNFFACRKGKAILKYMRLSSGFFSMGYFYSEGIEKKADKYVLYKRLEVPYYQPLPAGKRNKKGDYKLSPSIDGRFWNKMDFGDRPVSNVKTFDTTIIFTDAGRSNELTFQVSGLPGVPVTIELCFLEGGKLSGVSGEENGNSFLEKGMGKYELDGDSIEFGPGAFAHRNIDNLEGERYSTHFGSLRTKGMHVYITGVTPFNHTIAFS